MKTFVLTPIKPTISQFDRNYDILLNYVRENFEALLIGAKRREKASNNVRIYEGESIIRIQTPKGSTVGISKIALTVGASSITCEKALHDVYNEIIILKDFAEDPEEGLYCYTIKKPRTKHEDIF